MGCGDIAALAPHPGFPTVKPTRKQRQTPSRLRAEQQRAAVARQREWSLGPPDELAATGRPGTDWRKVADLTDALRVVEHERRVTA